MSTRNLIQWPAAYPLAARRYRACIQRDHRTIWECRHRHRTDDAAQQCAAKTLRLRASAVKIR